MTDKDEEVYLRYIEKDDDKDLETLLTRHRDGLFLRFRVDDPGRENRRLRACRIDRVCFGSDSYAILQAVP